MDKGGNPSVLSETENLCKNKVLIACTGSVASIKIPPLIAALKDLPFQVEMKLISTEHSLHFFDHSLLPVQVYRDEDEWKTWQKMQDPVLHIELRRWADVMVISPLDANTLAKIAAGICDNLLTCTVRAWDRSRPLLFAPAMNTYMWDHPLTSEHIKVLQDLNYTLIPTIEKTLACGDTGYGAMAEVMTITQKIKETLEDINKSSCT